MNASRNSFIARSGWYSRNVPSRYWRYFSVRELAVNLVVGRVLARPLMIMTAAPSIYRVSCVHRATFRPEQIFRSKFKNRFLQNSQKIAYFLTRRKPTRINLKTISISQVIRWSMKKFRYIWRIASSVNGIGWHATMTKKCGRYRRCQYRE